MNDFKHNKESSSWRTNVAFGIIGTSFLGTIALISPFVTMQLKSPLPYMATPRNKVVDALNYIAKRKRKSIDAGQGLGNRMMLRYYDLGSGDGETVLAAGSLGWKATGIELNSTLWSVSSLRRLMCPSSVRRQCDFILGNMWVHRIHDADAVMIFGVKPLMPKIAEKIKKECKPGTFVMSYRFLIPCKAQSKDVADFKSLKVLHKDDEELETLDAELVYDKDEMRIYELGSSNNNESVRKAC